MFPKSILSRTLALLLAALLPAAALSAAPKKPQDAISVLSFNLRLSTANDGDNSWGYRRDTVVRVIMNYPDGAGPYDFIGTQETIINPDPELNQRDFLASRLTGYASMGRSRDTTLDKGEGMILFWKKDRWHLDPKDNGTFWLSATPEVPGSKAEGASKPRTAVFGLFHELDARGTATGRKIYVYDTHLDHISEIARQRGAKALLEHAAARKDQSAPVVIMGDMNCDEKSPSMRFLQGEETKLDNITAKPPMALTDTFFAANPKAKQIGTFNGFKTAGKKKIDFIFASSSLKTLSAQIIGTRRDNGGFPSDHFPIEAVLTWKK